MESKPFDLESILSLDAIRTHTKTDDALYVTDEQLALYRLAGFEAAGNYTGRLFSQIKQHDEPLAPPSMSSARRRILKLKLRYPSSDGQVAIYGSPNKAYDRIIQIEPGTRELRIENYYTDLGMDSCCSSFGGASTNFGMRASYRAGICGPQDVPAGIIVGVLKWIAWNVMHPGDEIMTVRNKVNAGESGIIGSNNVALISGAIEQWRQYTIEF